MTSNYHTPITNGAAANAAIVNAPLAQLDAAVGTAVAAAQLAQESVLAVGTAATLADGAANAGQKVVTVDDSSVFVAGATVEYALVGGVIETNTVDTVDSGTQITLSVNIGTGGIPDNGLIAVVPPAYSHMRAGVYNVLDYGATGDGVTDDATAIQAAITAAHAAGGIVYLPAGTYLVNTELQVRDNVSIIGQGIGATIITTGITLANGVINIWESGSGSGSGADNVTLRDFALEANGAARIAADLGGYVRGIRSLYGPENLLIQRVKVNDGGERAIEIYQPVRCQIKDCIITNTSVAPGYEGDAIHVEGSAVAYGTARNIIVQGNIVETWGDTALAVPACTEIVVANNVIRGRAAFGETPTDEESGIDLLGVQHGVCIGNKIYQVRNLAIAASDFATGDGFASNNITISNNTIVGDAATVADYAIRVGGTFDTAGCGNYVISGNSIKNAYYPAIGVAGPCADVTVTGNTIVDAMLEGAGDTLSDTAILIGIDYTKNATRVLCAGNTIRDTGAHLMSGIYVNAANTDNVVYGNLVSGGSVVLEAHFVGAERATYTSSLQVLGGINVNPLGADNDVRVGGDNDVALLFTDASADAVGVGIDTPAGKLHVDQSSATAAQPVLLLDQADVSEEMIEFTSTVGPSNAIEAVGGKTLTTTHFVKCTITGVGTVYLPVGTIA